MKSLQSHSSGETILLGKTFASTLKNGDIVALSGDLGTGKTHFIAGVCQGLGVHTHVASPTFTIINEYQSDRVTIVHIDLYRITSNAELIELGIEEYFGDRYICLIEWAERMAALLPPSHIQVKLAYGQEDNTRLIQIEEVPQKVMRTGGLVA